MKPMAQQPVTHVAQSIRKQPPLQPEHVEPVENAAQEANKAAEGTGQRAGRQLEAENVCERLAGDGDADNAGEWNLRNVPKEGHEEREDECSRAGREINHSNSCGTSTGSLIVIAYVFRFQLPSHRIEKRRE